MIRLQPARKCGEFRVGGIPGRTSGAFEGINSIVMSETVAVKSFFGRMDDGVVDAFADACAVDLGIFRRVHAGSDPPPI